MKKMPIHKTWYSLFTGLRNSMKNPSVQRNAAAALGICTACSALAAYQKQNRNRFLPTHLGTTVIASNTYCESTHAGKQHQKIVVESPSKSAVVPDIRQHSREKRFHDFASVQVNGEFFMTPQDFLESVTDENPRPRVGYLLLSDAEVKKTLAKTPSKNRNSSRFFRSLHNNGLISYTEYLFLLCILTKPRLGFEIAFNMFDVDGNRKVDRKEFLVLEEIFRTRTEKKCYDEQGFPRDASRKNLTIREKTDEISEEKKVQDTTLLVHFFGKNGKDGLPFNDFYDFMENLQTEVLEMEFLTYSKGMSTISEYDFARVLLRFTEYDDIEECIANVMQRIPEEKGISFEEFRSFFQFLNDLEDFAIAMHLYTLAGKSIGQDEFKRAVKISTGSELSENLVHTLFQIFDKDGDNKLSHLEFIGVMKDRIQRGFRQTNKSDALIGWNGFKHCLRHRFTHD